MKCPSCGKDSPSGQLCFDCEGARHRSKHIQELALYNQEQALQLQRNQAHQQAEFAEAALLVHRQQAEVQRQQADAVMNDLLRRQQNDNENNYRSQQRAEAARMLVEAKSLLKGDQLSAAFLRLHMSLELSRKCLAEGKSGAEIFESESVIDRASDLVNRLKADHSASYAAWTRQRTHTLDEAIAGQSQAVERFVNALKHLEVTNNHPAESLAEVEAMYLTLGGSQKAFELMSEQDRYAMACRPKLANATNALSIFRQKLIRWHVERVRAGISARLKDMGTRSRRAQTRTVLANLRKELDAIRSDLAAEFAYDARATELAAEVLRDELDTSLNQIKAASARLDRRVFGISLLVIVVIFAGLAFVVHYDQRALRHNRSPASPDGAQPNRTHTLGYTVELATKVRALPTTTARVVGQLAFGAVCEIRSRENGWSNVDCGGVIGWLSDSVLSTTQPTLESASAELDTASNSRETVQAALKVLALDSANMMALARLEDAFFALEWSELDELRRVGRATGAVFEASCSETNGPHECIRAWHTSRPNLSLAPVRFSVRGSEMMAVSSNDGSQIEIRVGAVERHDNVLRLTKGMYKKYPAAAIWRAIAASDIPADRGPLRPVTSAGRCVCKYGIVAQGDLFISEVDETTEFKAWIDVLGSRTELSCQPRYGSNDVSYSYCSAHGTAVEIIKRPESTVPGFEKSFALVLKLRRNGETYWARMAGGCPTRC